MHTRRRSVRLTCVPAQWAAELVDEAALAGVVAYIGLLDTVAGGGVQAVTTAAWQILVTVAALLIGVTVANTIVSPSVTL